jgi:uncharacterized coiled-coil DUF342 family protein
MMQRNKLDDREEVMNNIKKPRKGVRQEAEKKMEAMAQTEPLGIGKLDKEVKSIAEMRKGFLDSVEAETKLKALQEEMDKLKKTSS